jgi:pimeloyl-ACP methyl ester carboxylesterase
MSRLHSAPRTGAPAPDLLVMIPGAHMTADDLVAAGFVGAVAARGLALEVRILDGNSIDMILGGTPPAPTAAELLQAGREGSRRVWLGGISLGGLLALSLAADALGGLDGLCLIAPYPGSRLTQAAIAQAGGLDVWRASAEQLEDAEFRVWRWLQRPPEGLRAFIGWGRQDRFAAAIGQLAGCFPPRARCIVDGGHDWATWRRLWDRFLDAGHFAA